MKLKQLLLLLVAGLTAGIARAESSDETLAKSYLRCAVISEFFMSTIDGATPQQAEAKFGWGQKRRVFIGSARALTSLSFASEELTRANEKFILDFGATRADERNDVKTTFRQLMNFIDDCEHSVQENKIRLLELAKQQNP